MDMQHLIKVNSYLKEKADRLDKENSALKRQLERKDVVIKKLENKCKSYEQSEKENRSVPNRVGKSYFDLCRNQRNKVEKRVRAMMVFVHGFLEKYHLKIQSMLVLDIKKADEHFSISFFESDPMSKGGDTSLALYVKETNNISDKVYGSIRTLLASHLPSLHSLISLRKNINVDLSGLIKENSKGFYLDVRQTIAQKIGEYIKENGRNSLEKFKIKLSADSTNIGHKLKLFNVTFTIINDSKNCKSEMGNHILGMFSVEHENYEEAKICLKEIFEEIEEINNQITVNGHEYKVQFYFSSDWKFLSIATGIKSASSKFPCIWCTCNKTDLHKDKISFNRYNSHKYNKKDHGHVHESLLPKNIPLKNVVMDTLHLFLRIGDSLINIVEAEVLKADGMTKNTKYSPLKHVHMTRYLEYMNKECNLSYTMYRSKGSTEIKGRTLRGGEKRKYLSTIRVPELLPGYAHRDGLQWIIREFYKIVRDIQTDSIDFTEIKERTALWMKKYVAIYGRAAVTPYMHAFHKHLYLMTAWHGNINYFNIEGLEKLNDVTTRAYFRSTNKKTTAVKQVLLKLLRTNYLKRVMAKKNINTKMPTRKRKIDDNGELCDGSSKRLKTEKIELNQASVKSEKRVKNFKFGLLKSKLRKMHPVVQKILKKYSKKRLFKVKFPI